MAGCVQDTATVHLVASGGVLQATAKISANPGNQLLAESDGLYASGAPVGSVIAFAGAAAPAGWVVADGSAISRATYAALFAVVSTTYGAGDGSTTFNLPDLRGRGVTGFAAAGGHVDVSTLGATEAGPVALPNRRPAHSHTNALTLPNHVHGVADPGHGHSGSTITIPGRTDGASGLGGGLLYATAPTTENDGFPLVIASAVTGITIGNPSSNPAINGTIGATGGAVDAPPYLVLNYIVKF